MNRRAWARWAVAAAVVLLAASPVDRWLAAAMPRLVLLEMPTWVGLGYVAARPLRARRRSHDPAGLGGLAFFLGALGFWMIPRSIDAIGSSALAHQAMHGTLLTAGAGLTLSVPRMSFVLRGALGIYGASMTFALGMVYTRYAALLCGTFDLAQQRETGRGLLAATPVVVLLVVAGGARALDRVSREAVADRAPRSVSRARRSPPA